MANLNKVLLIGRLTRDPESRTTPGGATVVALGLAVNRTYTRRDSGPLRGLYILLNVPPVLISNIFFIIYILPQM